MILSKNNHLIFIIYRIFVILGQISFIRKVSNLPFIINIKELIKIKIFKYEKNKIKYFKKFLEENKTNKSYKKNIFIEIYSLRPGSFGGTYRVAEEIVKNFLNDKNLKKKYNIFFFLLNHITFKFDIIDIQLLLKKKIVKNIYSCVPTHEGDKVLFLGNDIIRYIKYKKHIKYLITNKKIFFSILIFDILPYLNPHWFNQKNYKSIFKKYILSLRNYNQVITISEKVKSDLLNGFKNFLNFTRINSVKLGSNFNQIKVLAKQKKKINLIRFLIVGTIEPRKGHIDMIKVFNKLAENDDHIELVIIGKLGWKYKKIQNYIFKSKFYKKRLFFYDNLNDTQLIKNYLKSDIVLVPSYDEGFGLPIVEGINFKKIVIARNIPIFRELRQNNLYFFPNKNYLQILKFFKSFIKKYRQHNIKIKKTRTLYWKDTYKKIKKLNKI